MDIEHYKDLALQKKKEHKKFLGNLKKKAPKNSPKRNRVNSFTNRSK